MLNATVIKGTLLYGADYGSPRDDLGQVFGCVWHEEVVGLRELEVVTLGHPHQPLELATLLSSGVGRRHCRGLSGSSGLEWEPIPWKRDARSCLFRFVRGEVQRRRMISSPL